MNTRLGSGFSIIVVMFFAIFSNPTLATTINFDGTGAPGLFVQTSPLTNTYSGLGVNFSGVDGVGGSILNKSGNFGFNALSGTDFLAFNTAVGTGNIQRISFDSAVSNVSIWAAGSATSMKAFDSTGSLVSLSSILYSNAWQQLSVIASEISYVELTGVNSSFAYDNLEFKVSAVPVPAALPLMASALGIFGISRRRNKSKAV